MNYQRIYISLLGFLTLLVVYSCVKQQVPGAMAFSGILISDSNKNQMEEPGEIAFFSFIQKVSDPNTTIPDSALIEEASLFLPDTTLHKNLSLFGVELNYTDSIRLLYYEFSETNPNDHFSYIGVFTKGGRAMDVLPLKKASIYGNAAVNVIDQEIIELEYYEVYDAAGYSESELAFEHYKIQPDGSLEQLTLPLSYTEDREFVEASTRLLSIVELKRYELYQLEKMEMELLADYGQRFSASPRWQAYFDKQYWYTPRHEKVDDLLSGLELINLRKIQSMQLTF